MRRILVVGPSWVGDTVLAQPLFKLLHERHAGLALDVLAPRWTFALRVDDAGRRALLARLGLGRGRPAVALCPGAEYGPAKRWPARYFGELAQGLAAHGCEVWLIGSRNDAQAGAEIERFAGGICRNLCGETTLTDAIDLL